MRRAVVLATAVLTAAAATGCGDRGPATVPTDAPVAPGEVRPDLVPATLGGLTATAEDITALEEEAGPDSYLASTRLWGLRTGTRLRATLQVGRFVPDGRFEDEGFRRRIVAQIGRSGSRQRLLGEMTVYVASSNEQQLYIWFLGHSLFVLSVAGDWPEPRVLLRAALELRP